MTKSKYTFRRIHGGGNTKPDLIFCEEKPIAFFSPHGTDGLPFLYVLQGIDREEFLRRLMVEAPDSCAANGIDEATLLDLFTERELDRYATISRVNYPDSKSNEFH